MSSSSRDVIDIECFCFQLGVSPHCCLEKKKKKLIMLISSTSFTCLPHLPDIKKQHLTD